MPQRRVRLNAPVPVKVIFGKPVFGFAAGDIEVSNGAISNFTGNNGATIYTFDVTPNVVGEVTVDIAAGRCDRCQWGEQHSGAQVVLGNPV